MLGKQLGSARKGRAFAQSQQNSQDDQRDQSAGEARGDGGQRPQSQPQRQGSIGVDPLDQPRGDELAGGVAPEERRDQQAHLAGRQGQLVLDQGRGGGDHPSVDIVDEHGQAEQDHHAPAESALGVLHLACFHRFAPKAR